MIVCVVWEVGLVEEMDLFGAVVANQKSIANAPSNNLV